MEKYFVNKIELSNLHVESKRIIKNFFQYCQDNDIQLIYVFAQSIFPILDELFIDNNGSLNVIEGDSGEITKEGNSFSFECMNPFDMCEPSEDDEQDNRHIKILSTRQNRFKNYELRFRGSFGGIINHMRILFFTNHRDSLIFSFGFNKYQCMELNEPEKIDGNELTNYLVSKHIALHSRYNNPIYMSNELFQLPSEEDLEM